MAHDEEDEFAALNLPLTRPVRQPKLRRAPFWMVAALVIALVATWLPLSFFAWARASTSDEPRVMLVQDMGKQPKFREQMSSDLFADGRADRMPVNGTVARGELHTDGHYWLGYHTDIDSKTGQKKVTFYDTFPAEVKVDDVLLARGKQRFEIYCSPCHGLDGSGNGLVNIAAHRKDVLAGGSTWVQPADMHAEPALSRPVGHIYNTINVGIRNMPPYGAQIPAADRWAIVAYVRALQLSQAAPASVLSPEQQQELK